MAKSKNKRSNNKKKHNNSKSIELQGLPARSDSIEQGVDELSPAGR